MTKDTKTNVESCTMGSVWKKKYCERMEHISKRTFSKRKDTLNFRTQPALWSSSAFHLTNQNRFTSMLNVTVIALKLTNLYNRRLNKHSRTFGPSWISIVMFLLQILFYRAWKKQLVDQPIQPTTVITFNPLS